MDFLILGPVEVRLQGRLVAAGSGRERFVLASLLLNEGRLVATNRLIDLLWDEPPPTARAQLHNMISNLRRRVREHGLIETRPLGYLLALNGHSLDLLEFRRLVDLGREGAGRGDHAGAAGLLGRALSLWRGPALADIPDGLAASVRSLLHEEKLTAAEARLEALSLLGRHDELLQLVTGLLAEHPHRESLYRAKMLGLARAGRHSEALDAYQQAYRRLVEDLGVDPGQPLRELHQRILRGKVDEVIASPGYRKAVVPRQLPPAAALQGRDRLVDEIVEGLAHPGAGMPPTALLAGQGGVGKTAIALAAAVRLGEEFADGQLYVDLRGAHGSPADPHAVIGTFLRALGVAGADIPEDRAERIALYRTTLADRRILIVLDDAASEQQVRPLLPGSPRCAAMITSRRRLGALIGVARWTIPVLDRVDAVGLLARIAGEGRVGAEPEAATEIVDLCGHLPLAVCIAAARLAAHTEWMLDGLRGRLAEARGRLDELTVGDLDVRASIALSYAVLDPAPRMLLRRLGLVTMPDWAAWAAQELFGVPAGKLLDELVEVHLVEPHGRDIAGQVRYRLHDLVADFARERAVAEDDPRERDLATDRLLSGWLALASEADERISHGTSCAAGLGWPAVPAMAADTVRAAPDEWFQVELPSLIDAVDQACRRGRVDIAGPLALRLSGFVTLRAYDRERERVFRQATTCALEHGADALALRLLGALYEACCQLDLSHELPDLAAQRLTLARRLDDSEAEVEALWQAGRAARLLGSFAEASKWLTDAVEQARERNVTGRLMASCLSGLANLHIETGHPEWALPLLEQSLASLGDLLWSREGALKLHLYAIALTRVGRPDDAERTLAEGLSLTNEIGYDTGTAYMELAHAEVDIHRRRVAEAAERINRSLKFAERLHNVFLRADALRLLGDLFVVQERLADAILTLRRALDAWHDIGVPAEIARTFARLERACAKSGNHDAAEEYRCAYQSILIDIGLDNKALWLPSS